MLRINSFNLQIISELGKIGSGLKKFAPDFVIVIFFQKEFLCSENSELIISELVFFTT